MRPSTITVNYIGSKTHPKKLLCVSLSRSLESLPPANDRPRKRRRPPPELAGMMRLIGDDSILLEPAIPEQEWDALKKGIIGDHIVPPFEKGGLGGFKNVEI